MKNRKRWLFLTSCALLLLALPALTAQAALTLTSNATGTYDGWDYEFWKDSGGSGTMTLNGGGTFSAQWSGINNILFRMGKKFDSTKTHQQIGTIVDTYSASYSPNGNSYLAIYGWTVDPLVEYYIVDSWGNWRPPGASPIGSISIDGGTYDIYRTTRVNQPSIRGTATFDQYWSVRTSKRTSGTISVSQHFNKWESLGLRMGKMYEVALLVEGYQSSGSANITCHTLTINGTPVGNGTGNCGSSGGGSGGGGTSTIVQAENMTKGGQYTSNISSPFTGVALYANNDRVYYTQYFASGTHSFSLRGASSNNNMARVDLRIGGQTKGTFYFGGPYPAVYTLNNISHGTGNQTVELILTADNGTWDAYIDYLEIR